MNKLALAAVLSFGLLSAVPAVHAAPVTIDAGTFQLTYEDQYLVGLNVSFSGGVFTLTGPGLVSTVTATGVEEQLDEAFLAVDGHNGKPFPLVLTPKAGYQITGVTESVLGTYSASVGNVEGYTAIVGAALVSNWVYMDGKDQLGFQEPYTVAAVLGAGNAPVQGEFTATGTLDFQAKIAELGLAPGAVGLADLKAIVGTGVSGIGSQATGVLTTYRLGVAVSPIPEPQGYGMLLAGLGVVGLTLARRRSK